MTREKVPISEILVHDSIYDELKGFEYVESQEQDFDSEKGFIDSVFILKRVSDGKFFRVIYTDYGHGNNNLLEQEAEEVFPEIVKTTIYN